MAFPLSNEEHYAIEARIVSQPELIIAAAVRSQDGRIVMVERPGRHGDCFCEGFDSDDEHGFITSHGRFVDRLEAGNLVLATGQGSPRGKPILYDNYLFSEDMWKDQRELDWDTDEPS